MIDYIKNFLKTNTVSYLCIPHNALGIVGLQVMSSGLLNWWSFVFYFYCLYFLLNFTLIGSNVIHRLVLPIKLVILENSAQEVF